MHGVLFASCGFCLRRSVFQLDVRRNYHRFKRFRHRGVLNDELFVKVPNHLGDALGEGEASLVFDEGVLEGLETGLPATHLTLTMLMSGIGKTGRFLDGDLCQVLIVS